MVLHRPVELAALIRHFDYCAGGNIVLFSSVSMTMPEHGRQNTRQVALALLLATIAGLAAPNAGAAQSALIPRVNRPPTLKDFVGMKPPADLAGQLSKVTGLVQRDPKDGDPLSQPTEVYLGYDEKNLYATFWF